MKTRRMRSVGILAGVIAGAWLSSAVDAAPDAEGFVFGEPMGTRSGMRVTQTRVETGSPAAVAERLGQELLLTSTQLFVGMSGTAKSDAIAPVVVWDRAGTPGDPMPIFGWSYRGEIAPIDEEVGGTFGSALAGDDTHLFVGAPDATVNGVLSAGAVHVYRVQDGTWKPHAVLTDLVPHANARFGAALAFDGATLVVGVPGRVDSNGRVVGGGDGFDVTKRSIQRGFSYAAPSSFVASLALGHSVGVHGSLVALGDPNAAIAPGFAPGMVFVLARDGTSSTLFVDQTLTTPSFVNGARFGERLDLDGNRLVVVAPGEPNGSVAAAGATRVYNRVGPGAWDVLPPILGDVADAGIDRCDLDGELLAVGARNWTDGAGPAPGRGWLYRLDGASPTLAATIVSPSGDGVTTSSGRAIALRDGLLVLSETHTMDPTGSQRCLRALATAGATSDCDGDGISDLDETLAGAADCDFDGIPDTCPGIEDCNDDGLPDACNVEWQASWSVNAPLGDFWWGLLGHGPRDEPTALLFVSRQTVPAGSDGVVRGVASDWIALDDLPQPCAVAIYADPNQDGDPDDATLLYKRAITPTVGPGLERVVVDPIDIGPPGTKYFIGLAVARFLGTPISVLVAEAAWSPGQPAVTWYATSEPFSLNFESPASMSTFAAAPSNILVAGLFRTSVDANGDLIPDDCTCTADFDASGEVTPVDLGILLGQWGTSGSADLDGDGIVGPSDLGLLLGVWGPCA